MNRWQLFKGPRAVLNALLDEILQFALLAQQAVPWRL